VHRTPPRETERCVREAVEVGYCLIDTAQYYRNEEGMGRAVRGAMADGVAHEDLFVTTKLATSGYRAGRRAIESSLRTLGLDWIDLVLIHWPHGDDARTWRALEEACSAGLLRSIGLSNFYGRQVEEIVRTAEILPVVDQVETHVLVPAAPPGPPPGFSRHQDRGLEPAGGRGRLLTHPVLARIAQDHEATPAQVPLAFQVRTGVITIPKRRFTASACSPSSPPTTANPAGARGTRPPPTSSSRTSTPAPTT